MELGIFEKFIMAVIVLHFIVGFGYLVYKLSPRKEKTEESETEPQK